MASAGQEPSPEALAELPVPGPAALQRLGHIGESDAAQEGNEGEQPPRIGDRVMVVQDQWLELILDGKKTMEIRGCKYRAGFVWLSSKGCVYGSVTITSSIDLTAAEFRARSTEHLWPENRAQPYKRLCGLLLVGARRLAAPVPYWRPPAAIGWNIFRNGPEDAAVLTSGYRREPKAKAKPHSEGKQRRKRKR